MENKEIGDNAKQRLLLYLANSRCADHVDEIVKSNDDNDLYDWVLRIIAKMDENELQIEKYSQKILRLLDE